jgi:hypothetical protein
MPWPGSRQQPSRPNAPYPDGPGRSPQNNSPSLPESPSTRYNLQIN